MPNRLTNKEIAILILQTIVDEDSGKQNDLHFQCIKVPSVSIDKFIRTIHRKEYDFLWIIALIYMSMIQNNTSIKFNNNNIHRYIAIAYILAIKQYDDTFAANKYINDKIGLGYDEIYYMEVDFLNKIDWSSLVDKCLIYQYRKNLINDLYDIYINWNGKGIIPISIEKK